MKQYYWYYICICKRIYVERERSLSTNFGESTWVDFEMMQTHNLFSKRNLKRKWNLFVRFHFWFFFQICSLVWSSKVHTFQIKFEHISFNNSLCNHFALFSSFYGSKAQFDKVLNLRKVSNDFFYFWKLKIWNIPQSIIQIELFFVVQMKTFFSLIIRRLMASFHQNIVLFKLLIFRFE